MGSGSSVGNNVILDDERVMRLAFKILDFSSRKLVKGKPFSRSDIAVEYWALRFAVLFLEKRGVAVFDNVSDCDAHYKELIDKISAEP